MKKQNIVGAVFFVAALALGFFMGRGSWNGVVFVSAQDFGTDHRSPAAIKKELDFSRLDGADLITASQKRLVTAARIILQNDDVGVELGHFVTRGSDGNRQLACDFYDRMDLRFEAEGIIENGEKPVMEIESPCRTGGDITRIEPVWIPVQKFLSEKAANMDLSYPELEGTNFHFEHMGSEWPTKWTLQSVRLFNQAENVRQVDITRHELHEILAKPLTVNWISRIPANQN